MLKKIAKKKFKLINKAVKIHLYQKLKKKKRLI